MHGRFHGRGRRGLGGEARHGGGRWRARIFEQGDLKLVILRLIAEKPRHGYEIIKAIEDVMGGAYSPSPGVVYPTLTLLEEMGHAALSATENGKKLYAATEEGRKFLAANVTAVDAAFGRAHDAGGDRKSRLRIRRAMENLSMAIRLRAGDGAMSDEAVDKITAAIDAAAQAVERA